MSTEAAVGANLVFLDMATGFPATVMIPKITKNYFIV